MIQWIVGSEFNLIQLTWEYHSRCLNYELESVWKFMTNTTNEETEIETGTVAIRNESVLQLIQPILPIFKLSRLFFSKLSEREMTNKQDLDKLLFTRISSRQLTILYELYAIVYCDMREIVSNLLQKTYMRTPDGQIDTEELGRTIKLLETRFESPLSIISSHFLPLVNSTPLGSSAQDYYRDWLATWSILFSLAIQQFKDALHLYSFNLS
ncbi:hypothetical protein MJO28_006952 [Puccinia striiformis f. sp. tritici]|uniref:Uncharacterized protein n=4 Tax=Puccinia striiformis TaxID=27350 RepID=A0A0L0VHQ0_9BASI|nr:hypothetical protein Pst134EA_013066 [Puccinia striiformis f. sp. tritici]KAI9621963.1 hypothetical protein H4Q26_015400 [Puccinia striiformis f. sp. tritici PST-130]KNE98494.1 hypothetical protein PSTG_08233 [Puccinia striiformis f. sp. tritici PST-78]POW13757.1 hypothetical protein PSTT_03477 [Puccinia striiformis]KAH9453951.1 hypothetical protein Pst134EB_014052 [Puccinia striiformis f. sp. tritici]KAH9465173.1 hypothetical protein Pst134EA_013066 [Puccinia striiformis f. sp. tritici]